MTRARILTAVLAAVLLLCAAAVYLDQQGFFGAESSGAALPAPTTPAAPATPPANPPANTSTGDGYGELK